MSLDRQQRRKARRDLLKHGEAALKRGLPLMPAKEAVVGLALVLRDTLADTGNAGRASRAAEIMHQVFEASLKAQPSRMEIACRKGCASCCHNWVGATAPELFLLARAIGATRPAPDLSAMLERAGTTAGVSIADRFGAKLPCALLVNGACSQYAARPTVCRQVTSTDLAACLDEYEGRGFNGEIEVSRVFLDHARNCRIPLLAALQAAGLSVHTYELGAGLRAAMASGAEATWLAGGDLFAAVAKAPSDPEPVRQAVRTIAAEVAAVS